MELQNNIQQVEECMELQGRDLDHQHLRDAMLSVIISTRIVMSEEATEALQAMEGNTGNDLSPRLPEQGVKLEPFHHLKVVATITHLEKDRQPEL